MMAIVLTALLAVTMLPAAGLQAASAYADEPAGRPATSGGDVALEGSSGAELPEGEVAEGAGFAFEGLVYRVADGAAALVGFEDGSALEGAVAVPERVSDGVGSATVAAVDLAEGQVAEGVTALSLPQTVERVETKGLASALPNLASIEVAGSEGAYSSAAGMLFRQERGEASSDGSTTLLSNAELLWAPPVMVVARIPIECKAVAEGAFADASALETVMAFGVMESIAEGAFVDEQVNRVTIVVPITNYASASEGEGRVSGSVQLSEGIPTSEKKRPWFDHGFDSDHIVSGAPFGEIDGVVAVSDEGVAEDRSLVTPLENGRSHLDLTPEEQAEKDARRGVDPDAGLSFSYQASMDLSVRWSGDVTATPAHLEIPAYATIDGVKYQVTAIEPNAFAGAVFLESLVIPEGITTIGESAFAGCSNLKEVSLPSTLRTIDYAAFKGTALESAAIPEGCTYVGGEAFSGCASLEDAYVGASTLVGADAFSGSPAEAYVRAMAPQAADGEASQSDEQGVAGEQAEPTAASDDGISAYATDTLTSSLTERFYPKLSETVPYDSMWRFGVLGSPYYDMYIYESSAAQYPGPDVPYAYQIIESGSLKLPQPWVAGMRTTHTEAVYTMDDSVTSNGRSGRCYKVKYVNPSSPAYQSYAVVFLAKPGVTIGNIRRYSPAGGFNSGDSPITNFATDSRQGLGGYLYASFTVTSSSVLSLDQKEGATATLTPVRSTSWTASGDKAYAYDTFTVDWTTDPGYKVTGVKVEGENASYDAATRTITMGSSATTVSLVVESCDLQITLNAPHGFVSSANGSSYMPNAQWSSSDSALTIPAEDMQGIGGAATLMVSGGQVSLRTKDNAVGYTLVVSPHNGWRHQGAWALSYRNASEGNWTDAPDFTTTGSTTIYGPTEWRLTPIITGVPYTITYDGNGAGNEVAGGQYTTGNGLSETPIPRRSGFWLAGWVWTNDPADMVSDPTDTAGFSDKSWYPGDGVDPNEPSFTISDSAYGNASLKAIWKPKTYKIEYDVSVTEKDDGSYWVDTPEDDVFVHPTARSVIASASNPGSANESWAFTKSVADYRSQDGIDASGLAAEGGALDEGTINYELPKVPFEGYLYKGWTKQPNLPAGLTVADPNNGPFLAFSADVADKLWPNQWNLGDIEPEGTHVESTNLITLYGVWLRQGVVTVNLESSDPVEVADGRVDDGVSVKVNGANVANTDVQPVAYWKDRGLMLYGEMGEPGHNITGVHEVPAADSKIADTRVVNDNTKKRAFEAPTRTGFRFLGWGDAATNTPYIKYFENAEGTSAGSSAGTTAGSHEQGFYLTPAGMERALKWDTGGEDEAADENQQETWTALWEIRTYEIELMVPGSTIKGYSGVKASDKQLNDDYAWDDSSTYKWEKEITLGDDKEYATSWRKATKEWKYYDAFYVPFYELNSPFNTYGGWFTGTRDETTGVVKFDRDKTDEAGNIVPIISEAEGRARYIDGGSPFRVSARGLGAANMWAGAPEGQETDLDNVAAPDGTITLWLYTEPVYINVSAPMGIFLANENPYVVGSDPRTVLEQEAAFTVKESNQNLVLTSITATDIVEADVEQGTYNANAAYPVDNVVTTDDDAGAGKQGITSRMLTLDTRTDGGKGTANETAYNQENSRVFWVSPVKTVEDYVVETDSAPNEMSMTSRVYFGFGSETESGMSANNGDNVVEDDPDDDKDFNFLKAFKLREAYDGTSGSSLSGRNGVAVTTDDAGVTYTCAESAGTGAGSTAGTVSGAKYRDPDNAEWTLAVAGGKYTLAKGDGTTVNVKKPVVYRDYSFWYGLDLNKCSFDLASLQEMVEADEDWGYNAGYRKPLVKLMFTFAVERVPNVSYGVAALSASADDAGSAGVETASLDERAGTEGGDVDAAELVGVGGVSAAR